MGSGIASVIGQPLSNPFYGVARAQRRKSVHGHQLCPTRWLPTTRRRWISDLVVLDDSTPNSPRAFGGRRRGGKVAGRDDGDTELLALAPGLSDYSIRERGIAAADRRNASGHRGGFHPRYLPA